MIYIVDTYAWIEYFSGSKKGRTVKQLLENMNNSFITLECCLAELKGWSIRNNIDFSMLLNVIEINSKIIPVLRKDWIRASEIKSEMMRTIRDFGLIDALLIAKQEQLKAKIITEDKHFFGLKDIQFMDL